MLDKDQPQEEIPRCTTPTVELTREIDTFRKMTASHEWKVDRAEGYVHDAILTKIHCVNCGLQVISIHSDIRDSAKRATASGNILAPKD